MFFSSRIRLKPLAQLCHRLATATSAGLDDRRIWNDEAKRGSRSQRSHLRMISEQLDRGISISDALSATGEFFPPLFRQMAIVGETSGQHGQTYKRLAQYYERTLAARRAFFGKLAWPAFQLGMALAVIGLLIWIMGMLPINTGPKGIQVDMLGWGLVGTRGLVTYGNILVMIGVGLLLLWQAARRRMRWTRRLQSAALRIPVLGPALKTLALSRFTWAMHLVLDTPMDLRRALPLALETTGNDHYARHGAIVAQRIEQGEEIHTALAATGVFPTDLLDAVAVGEQSGSLVESMSRLSHDYQERAALAIGVLAQIAGYVVWLLVAGFIIMMIFRLFSFYTGQIEQLL